MIQEMMYKALEQRFQANIDEAETTIEIYFNNSVGIGEHPQHLNEIKKHIDIISTNEGRLDILTKYFSDYNESKGNK
tara:strand:+ start:312 stop:542 length:231 start_codon:yes stop_codon:yes gene_type:complete